MTHFLPDKILSNKTLKIFNLWINWVEKSIDDAAVKSAVNDAADRADKDANSLTIWEELKYLTASQIKFQQILYKDK